MRLDDSNVSSIKTAIYADDSTLSSRSNWKTISSLNQTLSDDLAEIERWTRGNKLYINKLNTKALLVTGKRLRMRTDQDSGKLEVVTKPLKLSKSQVIHCTFLGVTLSARCDILISYIQGLFLLSSL